MCTFRTLTSVKGATVVSCVVAIVELLIVSFSSIMKLLYVMSLILKNFSRNFFFKLLNELVH